MNCFNVFYSHQQYYHNHHNKEYGNAPKIFGQLSLGKQSTPSTNHKVSKLLLQD